MRSFKLKLLVVVVLLMANHHTALAQGTTQYLYDANGRLSGIIAPDGSAAIYRYDPAGNLTGISQIAAGGFAVLSFSPSIGTIGDSVTLTGVGLDTATTVSFNGTPGQIVSASTNSLTTAVPAGATTGLITVSGVRGAASSPSAFEVVARVDVNPTLAELLPNETIQFFASVIGTTNQQVTWAVNGIAGGNSSLGTISAGGVYLAPNISNGLTVTISATSQLDGAVAGQATVRILNPNTTSEVRAALVMVAKGVAIPNLAGARPVSVARSDFTNDFVTAHAVAVSKGNFVAAVARPLAVELGPIVPLISAPVSATTGPVISSISPATLTHGTAATVTVTGRNLVGVTSVFCLKSSTGGPDTNIGISNIATSPDGTTLTFTATLAAGAAIGTDVVEVIAQNGSTTISNLGSNTVQVQ